MSPEVAHDEESKQQGCPEEGEHDQPRAQAQEAPTLVAHITPGIEADNKRNDEGRPRQGCERHGVSILSGGAQQQADEVGGDGDAGCDG